MSHTSGDFPASRTYRKSARVFAAECATSALDVFERQRRRDRRRAGVADRHGRGAGVALAASMFLFLLFAGAPSERWDETETEPARVHGRDVTK